MKNRFPQKRLFKSSDKTVRERIKSFNDYLSYLCCNINIFLSEEILNFIEIKKDIIQLFLNKYNMLNIDEENEVLISIKKSYNKIKRRRRKEKKRRRGKIKEGRRRKIKKGRRGQKKEGRRRKIKEGRRGYKKEGRRRKIKEGRRRKKKEGRRRIFKWRKKWKRKRIL